MGTEIYRPNPIIPSHVADLAHFLLSTLSKPSGMWQHVIVALSVAAIVAPFSFYTGLAFSRFLKLPQITGYLISGIICGPYLLGILSKESVLDLNIVEGACLSIIGLAAGAELDWTQLAKSRKQVHAKHGYLQAGSGHACMLTGMHMRHAPMRNSNTSRCQCTVIRSGNV